MDICNGHSEGEVCYEGRKCPACEIEIDLKQMIEWYGSMNPWAAESIRSALKYLEEYIAFLESNRK